MITPKRTDWTEYEKDRANKPELSVMVFPQQARQGQEQEASNSVHQPLWDKHRQSTVRENQKDVSVIVT